MTVCSRPEGRHLPDDATDHLLHDSIQDCQTCPGGRYTAEEGFHGVRCRANTFITDDEDVEKHDNERDCVPCLVGQHSDPGARICRMCAAAGKYSIDHRHKHDQVEECPAGRFQPSAGSTSARRARLDTFSARKAFRTAYLACLVWPGPPWVSRSV